MWQQKYHLPPFEAIDANFDVDEYFEENTEYEALSRLDIHCLEYWFDYDFWSIYRTWNIKVSTWYCWVYDAHCLFEFDDDNGLTTEELIIEGQKLINSFWHNYPSPNQLILPGLEALVA